MELVQFQMTYMPEPMQCHFYWMIKNLTEQFKCVRFQLLHCELNEIVLSKFIIYSTYVMIW